MTRKEQIEQRRRQWETFNRWEEQQQPLERDPGQILADLGLSWAGFRKRTVFTIPTRRSAVSRLCWQPVPS
ncbi:MAG: hypothetical protein ABSF64_15415 [Bryobacteraceae bacterium]|jgi:hypothetical protein